MGEDVWVPPSESFRPDRQETVLRERLLAHLPVMVARLGAGKHGRESAFALPGDGAVHLRTAGVQQVRSNGRPALELEFLGSIVRLTPNANVPLAGKVTIDMATKSVLRLEIAPGR